MNTRTLGAVGACTRTLGGAPDADATLLLSGAVTLGPLRAYADRLALRRRFHDEAVDLEHRPADAQAAALFDALGLARLDALGVGWLAGVAHNLLAFPGIDDDGVRWVAFEIFSGAPIPREKADLAARTRTHLTASLLAELTAVAANLDDYPRFAAVAAEWCRRASGDVPAPVVAPARDRFNIPKRPVGTDIRRGRYTLPGASRRNEPRLERPRDASSSQTVHDKQRERVAAASGYRIYTTEFDRIVNASAIASRDDLMILRSKLEAGFTPVQSMVSRIAKRLMRVLMARQTREWRFDLEDGLLDPSRLPVFVASGGAARPFKQEFDSPFPSTVVTLLIDHSGSMKGRPMQIAALTVEIFARVLERCGVRCEILGFTTREWDGGEPARKWAADGYPAGPGRLSALEHIVIKAADVPWRRARPGLGLFLRDEMLKENIDGEALMWAHQRLLARSERRRILVVVSDGTPMDEATFAANGFDYLDGHLAAVVHHIETRSQVQLAAIGIGHDVSRFYRNATRISRIDDLGPALTTKLISLLEDRTP